MPFFLTNPLDSVLTKDTNIKKKTTKNLCRLKFFLFKFYLLIKQKLEVEREKRKYVGYFNK